MWKFIKKYKKSIAVAISILTLIGVAFTYPEHAETVAKAFLVLIGAL